MTAQAVKKYLNLDGNYVFGVDVSKWNGAWNPVTAYDNGARFAFIRGGYSAWNTDSNYRDQKLDEFAPAALDTNLLVSFYWYFMPNHNPVAQAQAFWAYVRDYPRHFGLVCDLEKSGGLSAAQIDVSAKAFADELLSLSGDPKMIFYGRGSAFRKWTGPWILDHDLWLARYNTYIKQPYTPLSRMYAPRPGHGWRVWQKSASVPGADFGAASGNIDGNAFNGTMADLLNWSAEYTGEPVVPDDATERMWKWHMEQGHDI